MGDTLAVNQDELADLKLQLARLAEGIDSANSDYQKTVTEAHNHWNGSGKIAHETLNIQLDKEIKDIHQALQDFTNATAQVATLFSDTEQGVARLFGGGAAGPSTMRA